MNNFSESVEKIVNNYIKRLKKHPKGLPEKDKDELVKEVQSHIYESFIHDSSENEIEQIFIVLDKLGEPAEVVSSRMPASIVTLGRKKKLPIYILSGILIALFGIPLGLTGAAVVFTLLLAIGITIFAFYLTAFSLILSGWIGIIVCIIRLINPYFGDPYITFYPVFSDPTLNYLLYLFGSILVSAAGIGLFFVGRYMTRGLKFLFNLTFERAREARSRRRIQRTNT
jgi:uncharacterized membrane protein